MKKLVLMFVAMAAFVACTEEKKAPAAEGENAPAAVVDTLITIDDTTVVYKNDTLNTVKDSAKIDSIKNVIAEALKGAADAAAETVEAVKEAADQTVEAAKDAAAETVEAAKGAAEDAAAAAEKAVEEAAK